MWGSPVVKNQAKKDACTHNPVHKIIMKKSEIPELKYDMGAYCCDKCNEWLTLGDMENITKEHHPN